VVFDAPVLKYYAAHEGRNTVTIVGPIFDPEQYGFVFAEGSELVEQVDRTLLRLYEDGFYEALEYRWFSPH